MPKQLIPFVLFALAACGGSGGGEMVSGPDPSPSPTPMPEPEPIIIPDSLGDTTITTPQDVTVFVDGIENAGTFTPSDQVATVGGNTFSALPATVNTGLAFTRLLENGDIAFIEPTGTVPTGRATFTGQGALIVTDGSNGDSYEGIANATLSVNFGSPAAGTLEFDSFRGQNLTPFGAFDVAGGSATINGVGANSSGLSGVTGGTLEGFGGADLTGATELNLTGAFAGPDYAEAIGTVEISGSDNGSSLVGNFAGSQ